MLRMVSPASSQVPDRRHQKSSTPLDLAIRSPHTSSLGSCPHSAMIRPCSSSACNDSGLVHEAIVTLTPFFISTFQAAFWGNWAFLAQLAVAPCFFFISFSQNDNSFRQIL